MFSQWLALVQNNFIIEEKFALTGVVSRFFLAQKLSSACSPRILFPSRKPSCVTAPACLLRASTCPILDSAVFDNEVQIGQLKNPF